jgi:hypothetical protein
MTQLIVIEGLFAIDQSVGSRILIADDIPILDPDSTTVHEPPIPTFNIFRISFPLFFIKIGVSVMLSSIPHTSDESWSHGFARSEEDIIIRFPALSV